MDDQSNALLLSIKWDYTSLIFCGTKTVELRRTQPRVMAGTQALVYAPSPHKILVGGFTIDGVISKCPHSLWKSIGKLSGVNRVEFMRYFDGVDVGHAIRIVNAWQLEIPVPLDVIRKRIPGFHPPQVFRYLDRREHERLVA